jgi:YihY family inner membrane protein
MLERLDGWQQRRRGLSFLVAIFVRYREDRGREYGALLSYYGFVSLFPLLLVLVTMLGIVLDDHADLRRRILDTVYERIPVIGTQLRESTSSIPSSGVALLVGVVVSLWAGLAVVRRAQDALNLQWGVPWFRRPGLLERSARALGALFVVGVGVLVATAATNVAAFLPELAGPGRLIGALLAVIVNVAVLTVAYRVLIRSNLAWRTLLPGGVLGGVMLWFLQLVGGEYVARVILDASDVYGTFAVMFGLLVWIALLARVTLLAGEVNVVLAKRLWPRTVTGARPTDADRRAATEAMERAALLRDARVDVVLGAAAEPAPNEP